MSLSVLSDPGGPPLTSNGFDIAIYDGLALDQAGWPSVDSDERLAMLVFQSREFVDLWMRTIGRDSGARGFLVVVRDRAGEPILFLPLAIERRLNIRVLRFMDAGVADLNAPILLADRPIADGEFFQIWNAILARLPAVDAIDLRKIAPCVGAFRNPLTLLESEPTRSGGHVMDAARAQDPGIASRHRKERRRLRRYRNRLAKLGTLGFVANPTGAAREAVLQSLFALKQAKYLRTFGYSFFDMPGVRDFYAELASPANLGRFSHLSAMTCDGAVVSAHLGFRCRGRFYYILPSFDLAFRAAAPGHLLLERLIQESADAGDGIFDLGEGDYSYKEVWETERIALVDHRRALTAAGKLFLGLAHVRREIIPDFVKSLGFGRAAKDRNADDAR